MTRVATFGNYQSALLHLMNAQARGEEAQNKVNTKKNATDLVGFGRQSETVIALKSSQTRIQGFIDTNKTVADRLTMQDMGLDRVADAATAGRQAIANAIAAGRMEGLMSEMETIFKMAQDGLNMKHQGKSLFSGGAVDQQAVVLPTAPAGTDLEKLAAMPGVAGVFKNDQLKQTSRLDETVTMDTGFLASDIGQALFDVFRDLQILHQGTPLNGQMDDAQKTALTALMGRFETAAKDVVNIQAKNGSMQARVDTLLESQEARKISVDTILSGKTDANMAQAVTELEMAQIAIQASAQVISQLRDVSLLNYLR
ncbi:flagellar hook-associated protein 3 FlgL [Brevundimonas bullata]|uniref:Flagellar hook-associated protein 3 FlgL n=1 Tax=Brevundimonas bullata TaxID=13160 RepID=A0A7W7N4X6_9CAUL|nr:flagellin [Brevundimonas bullata]MBB4798841.1 flagellar hook-associated protein 3 FlgL [Brevundimonas bullata]MBB6383801.1 flagellar hook-associated protein 3 FlgL [Brevundimonas bullata]